MSEGRTDPNNALTVEVLMTWLGGGEASLRNAVQRKCPHAPENRRVWTSSLYIITGVYREVSVMATPLHPSVRQSCRARMPDLKASRIHLNTVHGNVALDPDRDHTPPVNALYLDEVGSLRVNIDGHILRFNIKTLPVSN